MSSFPILVLLMHSYMMHTTFDTLSHVLTSNYLVGVLTCWTHVWACTRSHCLSLKHVVKPGKNAFLICRQPAFFLPSPPSSYWLLYSNLISHPLFVFLQHRDRQKEPESWQKEVQSQPERGERKCKMFERMGWAGKTLSLVTERINVYCSSSHALLL